MSYNLYGANYDVFFEEDHYDLRDMAKQFADKSLAAITAHVDESEVFPEEVYQEMADMGLMGLRIPEAYGGAGLDVRSYVSVVEETARHSMAATVLFGSAGTLGSEPILHSGTEEQKQKYLPGLASGEGLIAFALTEPNAGSDAASLKTKAVKDGDDYILNGRKCFISLASIAAYAVVYAKTSPEKGAKGITAFVVDMKLPGVSVGKPEEKMGQRGAPVNDILLEDVRVSKDCILGEIDMGFINAMKTLSVGRVGVGAMAMGMARQAMDSAVEHIKTRQQFGKPLAKNQGLQFMVADMGTKMTAANLMVYNAATMLDKGLPSDQAASMAKYYATESACDIINKSLQLFGGYGYSKEYPIERLYRDVRITTIYEGSSQIQQMVIAGGILK